jgi:tetratricopeptide (TPR) repeat protein
MTIKRVLLTLLVTWQVLVQFQVASSSPLDPCLNSDSYEYTYIDTEGSEKPLSCSNIRYKAKEERRKVLCLKDEVRLNCPQSCGLCCSDLPLYNFTIAGGIIVTCESLSNSQDLKEKFCDKYRSGMNVKNGCPVACNNCRKDPTSIDDDLGISSISKEEGVKKNKSKLWLIISLSLLSFIILLGLFLGYNKRRKWNDRVVVTSRSGTAKMKQHEYNNQLKNLKNNLKLTERGLGKDHIANAKIHYDIGTLAKSKGDKKKSLDAFMKSLQILQKHHGRYHINVAALHCNIGEVYKSQYDYHHSISTFQKALIIHTNLDCKKSPNVALVYLKIGELQQCIGDFDGALKNTRNALIIEEKVYGKLHQKTARTKYKIGFIWQKKRNHESAFMEYRSALEILIDSIERDYHLRSRSPSSPISGIQVGRGSCEV